jgi:hypothetical protein
MPVTNDVPPDSARELIAELQARVDSAEREAAELRELLSGELAELRAAVQSLTGSKAKAPSKGSGRNRVIDAAGPSLGRWLF